MMKNGKKGFLYLVAGGTILCFPIFRILSQDLTGPFIGLLTLGIVLIITGIFNLLNVANTREKGLILICIFTAPILGILGYLIILAIVGPMVIDAVGIPVTKLMAIVLSVLNLAVYGRWLLFSDRTPKKSHTKNRKIRDIIFTCSCFALAPFGFAGQLSYRGGDLGPKIGGTLCVILGLYFLYQCTEERAEKDE